jgi:two-component system, cell cycle sensor histidine kinase and response regulator CckA
MGARIDNQETEGPAFRRWGAMLAVALACVFAVDAAVPLGLMVSLLYPPIVLAAARFRSTKALVVVAAVASALVLLDVAVSPGSVVPMWVVWIDRALALAMIWATVLIGRRMAQMRDQAVQDLERNEARLRAVLDTASEAIITIDGAGAIHSFNRAAEHMFGWPAAEIVGRNVSALMPEPDSSGHDGYIRRFLCTSTPRVIGIGREGRGMRKDGTSFPIELSVSEVHVGGEHRFTGILRDLTERRRLEEQFRRAQKMEAVGRLASGIAHEYNNLLMGIVGAIGVARKRADVGPETAALLGEIREAAQRGASLSRHLLDYSRQEPVELDSIGLNHVARRAERVLRSVIGEDVRLEIDLCPGEATILGNPHHVEQMLLDLSVNARDAMPRGGKLRISTRELELAAPRRAGKRDLRPGRYVALEIEDTGSGMTSDVLERLFEPFFTTKPAGTGTGLGLYTVYGIVERLQGAIDVASAPGRGTKFTIYVPRAESPAKKPDAAAATAQLARAETQERARRVSETILLVEDERLIRVTLRQELASLGYTVLVAADGEEALRTAGEHQGAIDLVLSDVVLPGIGGPELIEALARARPGIRSVVMSAHPAHVLEAQGRIRPGTRTLEKPFTEESLSAAVREALQRPEIQRPDIQRLPAAARRPTEAGARGSAASEAIR